MSAAADRVVLEASWKAALLAEFEPVAMSIENVFYGKNARSALTLGHARGAIIVAAAQRGVQVVEYAPREIKKAVVGTGGADKNQVAYMVRRHLRLRTEPRPSDAADGIAVALCHAFTGLLPLREARQSLDRPA